MINKNPYQGFLTEPKGKSLFLMPTILTGLGYLITQWFNTGNIVDSPFVGLLFGATIILVLGIAALSRHVTNQGLNFFTSSIEFKSDKELVDLYKNYCSTILYLPGMIITGVLYGFAIALTPYLFDIWSEQLMLRHLLALFLLAVNFVTGAALYSLVRYVDQTYRISPLINIDLWQANSGKTEFILGMTRKMSVLASLYIALSLTSILFSQIPVNAAVISYGIFSGIILLSVLFVTPAPVVQKLKDEKLKMLSDLDERIHDLLVKSDKQSNNDDTLELERMKSLLDLREKIENHNVWPFKAKSVLATISVVFFSYLPILVRNILEMFFGS